VLAKASPADNDVEWVDQSVGSSGSPGGAIDGGSYLLNDGFVDGGSYS